MNDKEWTRYLITRRTEKDYAIKQLKLADTVGESFFILREALKKCHVKRRAVTEPPCKKPCRR
ncbi:MAG: hypothetical protein U0Y68_02815 [Blastocatellia bacterium]